MWRTTERKIIIRLLRVFFFSCCDCCSSMENCCVVRVVSNAWLMALLLSELQARSPVGEVKGFINDGKVTEQRLCTSRGRVILHEIETVLRQIVRFDSCFEGRPV